MQKYFTGKLISTQVANPHWTERVKLRKTARFYLRELDRWNWSLDS